MQVGCRAITTFDAIQGKPLAAWLLYPTHDPAQPTSFGPYPLELAHDGAPIGDALTLVALSHGNGGTPWSHRGLACHLAREGFAVLMIEHPGNNRRDNSLGTPDGRVKAALLGHRPRHVSLAVDAALADPLLGPRLDIDTRGYGIIGESIGGYTALAVAGGRVWTLPDELDMARIAAMSPAEMQQLAFEVDTTPDPRLRAAVLLVPAVDFFSAPGALAAVDLPILLRTGERDPLCPTARILSVLSALPDPSKLSSLEVPGAGHFSLQTPYPPALARIPPAADPPGFDRAGYQPVFFADVAGFLRESLSG